jgi:hypothetical protein
MCSEESENKEEDETLYDIIEKCYVYVTKKIKKGIKIISKYLHKAYISFIKAVRKFCNIFYCCCCCVCYI